MKISFLSRLLDFLAPRRCPVCGARMAVQEDAVCTNCMLHLPRTGFPAEPYDNEMARLFFGRLPIERAAALFFYQSGAPASRLIAAMKYSGHPEYAHALGRMMAQEMADDGFFDGIDLIVPVPLARSRQRQRGYNQSQEIACGIAEVTGIPVDAKSVCRVRETESQTTKAGYERTENMKDAFRINGPEKLAHRHLLLVDDVLTTGSTVMACAEEIMKAEDVRFSVLTLGFTKN